MPFFLPAIFALFSFLWLKVNNERFFSSQQKMHIHWVSTKSLLREQQLLTDILSHSLYDMMVQQKEFIPQDEIISRTTPLQNATLPRRMNNNNNNGTPSAPPEIPSKSPVVKRRQREGSQTPNADTEGGKTKRKSTSLLSFLYNRDRCSSLDRKKLLRKASKKDTGKPNRLTAVDLFSDIGWLFDLPRWISMSLDILMKYGIGIQLNSLNSKTFFPTLGDVQGITYLSKYTSV